MRDQIAESTGPDQGASLGSRPMARTQAPPDDHYTEAKPGESAALRRRRLESRLEKVGPTYEAEKIRQIERQRERDAIIRCLHGEFGVTQPTLATMAGTTRQNVSLITPSAEERKRREDENTRRKLERRRTGGSKPKKAASK